MTTPTVPVTCTRCLMPATWPGISFDAAGVCDACRRASEYAAVDWGARRAALMQLVAPCRSTDGSWDCVVPWSGGKDSSTVAWRLKFEIGLNPLLVTFAPLLPTEIGRRNREAMIQAGFDHVYVRPNQKVHRHLAQRCLFEHGNPKFAWRIGANHLPVRIAVQFRIPLVCYTTNWWAPDTSGGSREPGFAPLSEVIPQLATVDLTEWLDDVVTEADLNPYRLPDEAGTDSSVRVLAFDDFFRSNLFENYQFIRTRLSFSTYPNGRAPGTFTDFDSLDDTMDSLYHYLLFVRYGAGRAVVDASQLIRYDQLARDAALELTRQFDGEPPDAHISEILDYLGLSRSELREAIDSFRPAKT